MEKIMSELIAAARAIALEALKDETRSNGAPFIEHPDAVAAIVSDEIGLGEECAAAVYLHEATRTHRDIPLDSFPAGVLTIVDGLNKISTIKPKDTRLEAENYKKLIVRYSTDPRVTIIKIADRLEVMRSLAIFPKASREQKILETLMLYIPLAHQLGLYNIKSELEDIYFRYADPEQYRAITNKLKATEKDRQRLTEKFIEPLKKTLTDNGISYKLKVRTKTAYSIYRKMQVQKVPFEGVFDVFAIRFIIDGAKDHEEELDLCWKVFGFVTEKYESDTKRLRDWLTQPKPNGYESLHITVKNEFGNYIEVQIRTRRMDEIAESGLASHWSYKGIKGEKTLDSWLTSVRYTLEHGSAGSMEDLPTPPKDEIFVFTPTGELKILPEGSSVLDFAFSIHSGLGCRCSGGKVNGKAVPIKEKLSTGDSVEIITSKNQHPGKDWLGWIVTAKARTKIKQELDAEERKKAAEGREILERRLKNWKLEFSPEMMRDLMKTLKLSSNITFWAEIADGNIDINDIKTFITKYNGKDEKAHETAAEENITKPQFKAEGTGENILVINARNVKGLDYKMSKCCNPVFGDDVFGFVTRTDGIKIHRISCPNAARLLERFPYRIQKVVWQSSADTSNFQCTVNITAELEHSILASIMEIIGQFKASIRAFNVNENERHGTYEISVRILVPSTLELDKIISQVSNLRQVIKVRRV